MATLKSEHPGKFINTKLPDPITSENVAEQLSAKMREGFDEMKSESGPRRMQGLRFCIQGEVANMVMPEYSDFVRNNLLYMDAYAVFNMESCFMTERTREERYYLLITFGGHGILEYEGQAYYLSEGKGFFIDARRPHRYAANNDKWMFGLAEFEGPAMAEAFRLFAENGKFTFSTHQGDLIQSSISEICSQIHYGRPDRDFVINALVSDILAALITKSAETDSASGSSTDIQYLVHYLDNNYMHDISMDYLSEFTGISKSHLSREFKKYTGYSPIDYVLRKRIDRAGSLLSSTRMSVKEISYELGFKNVNSFLRLFKLQTGETPGQWRRDLG